ncbi:ligand-gated channel, partial [Xanthomonas perforans]
MPSFAPSFRRSALSLALTSLLTPALAMAEDAPVAADGQTPPSSDTRHDASPSSGRHIKDLDKVVVTASPLRDAAGELSRPVEVLAGERLDEVRSSSLGE